MPFLVDPEMCCCHLAPAVWTEFRPVAAKHKDLGRLNRELVRATTQLTEDSPDDRHRAKIPFMAQSALSRATNISNFAAGT